MKEKLILVILFAFIASFEAASVVQACQVCDFHYFTGNLAVYAFCRSAGPDEVGATYCTTTYDPLTPAIDCTESGTFCTTITVGGGSGGSGGGGGCTGSGFCPASCFSCGGGGRGPAI